MPLTFLGFPKKRRRNSSSIRSPFSFHVLEDRLLLAITDIRLVTYNALNFTSASIDRQDEFQTVFEDLNADVVVMQEITSAGGADILLDALNGGSQNYARAEFVNGNDTDHALFYNSAKIELVAQDYIPTALREFGEYTLSVDGTEFNVYSAHLKASQGSTNQQLRLNEVTILREQLEMLPSDMEFIVAGDMNIYGASEPAYQKLVGSEANDSGRLEDLIASNLVGQWHENSAFASVHTQSPRTTSFGGGAIGGLDDRFDMIFGKFGLNDGIGIEYVTDSYFVHGNDGLHFNQAITDGTNNSASPAVIQALHDASDHLPVVADFQIISDSTVGVSVVESGASTDVAEGGNGDTYQVVLDTVPNANVVINVNPDSQLDVGNGAGNALNLIFTPENALVPQTVFVSANDDSAVEGAHSGLIQHTVSSTDLDYNNFPVANVNVSVTDNDVVESDFLLNEIYVNVPGADNNREFVEITAPPLTPLTDVWLLEVEGDGPNAGTIDNAQNLSSLTSGSNGLILLGQNYSTSTPWGSIVDPATTVENLIGGTMENGTITFMLVAGFSGSSGDDLDSNNDGQLDVTPWAKVLDSVGWTDGDAADHVYTSAKLVQSGTPDAATRIPQDERSQTFDAWYNGDITGTETSTTYGNGSSNLPADAVVTPGTTNFGMPAQGSVTILQTSGTTVVSESGAMDRYSIVLNSIPAANVVVQVTPGLQLDLGNGPGQPIGLLFTVKNALTPQVVYVAAVNDSLDEGGHTDAISHSVVSADLSYDGIIIEDVVVSIVDNELSGAVWATPGTTSNFAGGAVPAAFHSASQINSTSKTLAAGVTKDRQNTLATSNRTISQRGQSSERLRAAEHTSRSDLGWSGLDLLFETESMFDEVLFELNEFVVIERR